MNKKNIIRKTGISAGALLLAGVASAQSNDVQTGNTPYEEAIAKTYKSLSGMADTLSASQLQTLGASKLDSLENFLGGENKGLYHGSGANITTLPESGENCIQSVGNNLYVRVIQIGSGYGKRNTGDFKAEARVSRDLSTTHAILANQLGLSDDAIKESIFLSNGILPQDQKIVRDDANHVVDILYIGNEEGRKDISYPHPKMNGEVSGKHILAVPGDDLFIPLKNALEMAGVDLSEKLKEYVKVPVIQRIEVPAPRDTNNVASEFLKQYNFGIMGSSRTGYGKQIGGLLLYTQIGERLDLVLGHSRMRNLNANNESFIQETMESENTRYTGVSERSEKGTAKGNMDMVSAALRWYVKQDRKLFVEFGAEADILNSDYNGDVTYVTYFKDSNGVKYAYDSHSEEINAGNNQFALFPEVSAGIRLGKVMLSAGYRAGNINNKYFGDAVKSGNFSFNFGLNFTATQKPKYNRTTNK